MTDTPLAELTPGSQFDGFTIDKQIGEGGVRLIDFGLAHHLDLPDHIYESFQEPKGTPAYLAPEQFFGVRDEPRSDIFSIGTMLYEMATSKLPFPDARSALDVVSRIKRAPLNPREYNPELSEAFAELVLGSTAYKVLTTIKCPIFVAQEPAAKGARRRRRMFLA